MDTNPSDKNIANDDELQTGYIQGNTFDNKEVKYRIINGMAIFEGDIILAATPKEGICNFEYMNIKYIIVTIKNNQ
jgi:hypothetical protein